MAVRVHVEKTVSAEEEQEWQVLMESVRHKSGRLKCTSDAHQGREPAVKRREKVKTCSLPGASRNKKFNLMMMMMMMVIMMIDE